MSPIFLLSMSNVSLLSGEGRSLSLTAGNMPLPRTQITTFSFTWVLILISFKHIYFPKFSCKVNIVKSLQMKELKRNVLICIWLLFGFMQLCPADVSAAVSTYPYNYKNYFIAEFCVKKKNLPNVHIFKNILIHVNKCFNTTYITSKWKKEKKKDLRNQYI